MANLLVEYGKRRNNGFVIPVDEGVLFFNKNEKPAAVCLTSTHTRSNHVCGKCVHKNTMIVELFLPTNSHMGSSSLMIHDHVHPDCDILRLLSNLGVNYMQPFYATDQRSIECWLWRLYEVQCFSFEKNSLWRRSFSRKKDSDETKQVLDRMAWCTLSYPMAFANFYKGLYLPFLAGRKYLLYRSN